MPKRIIRMLTTASGPTWRANAGALVELDAVGAAALIEGRYAEPVSRAEAKGVPEAALEPAGETAELPRAQTRRVAPRSLE